MEYLEDVIQDSIGLLHEALHRAEAAETAAQYRLNLELARRKLMSCQRHFSQAEQRLASDLFSYEKVKDLAATVSEQRHEWPKWADAVELGIPRCQLLLNDASKSLAACWEEVAEHAGMTGVSVRVTSVGQEMKTADGREPSGLLPLPEPANNGALARTVLDRTAVSYDVLDRAVLDTHVNSIQTRWTGTKTPTRRHRFCVPLTRLSSPF